MKTELLLLNHHQEELIDFPLDKGHIWALSQKSPYRDDENEDSGIIKVIGEHIVMAVADGAGGHPAGQKASKLTLESLLKNLNGIKDPQKASAEDLRNAIINGFEEANLALIAEGTGLATTLVVCHIYRGNCRMFHTGDSEALIISGAGNLKYKTPPHSPVGHAVEAGLITQLESLQHPERNIVSHFIGRSDLKIEIGAIVPLAARDTVIVSSDGLTDNFSHLELQEYFKSTQTEDNCQFLIKELNARMKGETSETGLGKPDDCTFFVFNFS
jgi:serine/threonine protein phosphatase PrpC